MFNLSFRLFGVSFRITIWFWVFAALFGYLMGVQQHGWQIFVLWIVCELVATIVKEIGHVIAGRFFGIPGAIVLGGMGSSSAVGEYDRAERWQRIVIYASGPIAGLLFYGVVYAATQPLMARLAHFGTWWEIVVWTLVFLSFLTLFWNLLNLLPILPMDGGRVLQNVLGYVVGRRDFVVAAVISVVFSLSVVAYSLYRWKHPEAPFYGEYLRGLYPVALRNNAFMALDPDPIFVAVIFGFYAVTNLMSIFRRPKSSGDAVRVA